VVEDGSEELTGFPRAAREEAILGAPIAKLTSEGTQGGGGEVRRMTGEETEAEPDAA
jgi:hypothetical protein